MREAAPCSPTRRRLLHYVWINRLCCNFSFDRRPMATWIASIKALEALDFDTVINSHWESGTKGDLVAFRQWLEDLQAAVSSGIKAGRRGVTW